MISYEEYKKNLGKKTITWGKTSTGRMMATSLPLDHVKLYTSKKFSEEDFKANDLIVIVAHPDENPENGDIHILCRSAMLKRGTVEA